METNDTLEPLHPLDDEVLGGGDAVIYMEKNPDWNFETWMDEPITQVGELLFYAGAVLALVVAGMFLQELIRRTLQKLKLRN